MTAKELLMPQFEVIAEYPKCQFIQGDILKRIRNATNHIYHTDEFAGVGGIMLHEIQKYPHLFRRIS